jgi:hypothetical protein
MDSPPAAPPADLALGRIVQAAAEMLERELGPLFDDYLDGERNRWGEPRYPSARQACRVMLLCRSLVEEIQRYQDLREDDDLNF